LIFIFGVFTGCSNEPEARGTLEDYLSYIKDRNYLKAYELVSDFDKNVITEDLFIEWRSCVDKIIKKNAFSISKGSDRFKNYDYMGTQFKDAYGFDVKFEQEYLLKGAETTDYDMDNFKIMVAEENGNYKVLLLIIDLQEKIEYYNKLLD
jgi:hypothetical protein